MRWLFRAAALGAVFTALAAGGIGLDPDQKWGPFRQALLVVGLLGIGLPIGARIVRALDLRLTRQRQGEDRLAPWPADQGDTQRGRSRHPEISSSAEAPPTRIPGSGRGKGDLGGRWQERIAALLGSAHSQIAVTLAMFAVGGMYVWFVSIGQITLWPHTTSYYASLADAFLHQRTEIHLESAPDLSGVRDPYHHTNLGNNLQYVVDYAYFKGRYYMYFGPVPAVLIMPVMAVTHRAIGDQSITFAGMIATLLSATLILLHLRRRYFPSLPDWLIGVGVIVAGTAHPMLWMLSWAAIYSAAIACGQAFLLGGLFVALPSIAGSETSRRRLAAAGLLWALAIGSRLDLVGAVAALTVAAAWGILRRYRSVTREFVRRVTAMMLPLAIVGVLLAAYNYVRFGDVLETGVRYTLNLGDPYYRIDDGQLFNTSYLLPNLLYYLAAPVNKSPVFPFIRPLRQSPASFSLFLNRLDVPESHSVELITGLLVAAPYIFFAFALVARLVCYQGARQDTNDKTFARIGVVMLAAGLLAGAPVLLYYLVNSRFLMDFSTVLIILSVTGSWILYRESTPYPTQKSIVITFIILAGILTLGVSFLLAMTGPATLFDDYNPGLWQWLRGLASW